MLLPQEITHMFQGPPWPVSEAPGRWRGAEAGEDEVNLSWVLAVQNVKDEMTVPVKDTMLRAQI